MPIDLERLRRQRRYEDFDNGVADEFLEHRLGPGGAFALLSAPLDDAGPRGWVISPSIGPEHGNLRRLETLLAGQLAASGFPVLRIRPDLHPVKGSVGEIDLSARLAETEEAVSVLAEASGVRTVGLVGALSGGMVAAMVADQLGSPELALIEPVSRGKRYIRETIRRQAIAELIASTDGAANGDGAEPEAPESPQRPLEELAATGETWVRGLRLTSSEYDRIAAVDLARDLDAFSGRSLLIGISPSGSVPTGLDKLRAHLGALGGDVTLELLDDPLPAPFGEYPFRNAGPVRIDTRLELDQRLARVTTEWAGGSLEADPTEDAA
jgi:hypothetical protein